MTQISEKLFMNINCVILFSLQIFSKIFLILMKIQGHTATKVHTPSRELPGILVRF
jgi:hypothetical protein